MRLLYEIKAGCVFAMGAGGCGWLGFHRIYLRKNKYWLLWFLTLGYCGIGLIYDLLTLWAQVNKYNGYPLKKSTSKKTVEKGRYEANNSNRRIAESRSESLQTLQSKADLKTDTSQQHSSETDIGENHNTEKNDCDQTDPMGWLNYVVSDCSQIEYKNEKHREFVPSYTVIDVETTGLESYEHKIVQFAALKVVDHKVVDSMSFLVNPGIHIPESASRINGIFDKDVADKAPFSDHVNEVLEFLGDDLLLGHNVSFDISFIESELMETMMNQRFDTLGFLRLTLHGFPNYKLSTLYKGITGKEPINAHDALADCYMTFELFEKSKARIDFDFYHNYEQTISYDGYRPAKSSFTVNPNPPCDSPFIGKNVVFEGKINGMTRKQAILAVYNLGGNYSPKLRQKTNYFVIGDYARDYRVKEAEEGLVPDKKPTIITAEEFKSMVDKATEPSLTP